MIRSDIINLLIEKINAKKYLEIGVSNGINFSEIDCVYKVGVDPALDSPATTHITSDDFFAQNKEKFDVIFIDGLHHSDQVYRDIINSLNVLNEGGYIVCHDMNPRQEEHQLIPFTGGIWNGDCWKAFVQLRRERSDLEMYVIDTDCGCGIIRKGYQNVLTSKEELTWNNLEKYRNEWLNLISTEDFLKKMSSNLVNTSADIPYFSLDLDQLLQNYVLDPENFENNFFMGFYYENIGQTASAVSYYLRAAERTPDDLAVVKYECLLRSSICFSKQGTRNFTVKGLLLHALSVCPKRPEAYYLMSLFYEKEGKDGSWNESYTIASIGLEVSELYYHSLLTDVGYPGDYALLFQKAVSSWWCGLCEDSRDLFIDLLENYNMKENFRQIAINNLSKMNVSVKPFSTYNKNKFDKLGFKFSGSENITENYSEAYQDMFVLTMLNGKKNGTYVEIGAGNAFYGNNTALLEKDFNWTGVAFDISEEFVNAHNNERKNPCLLKNALTTDYNSLLSGMGFPKHIDYLQLDCDPPEVTYKILLTIPFETYKFAVITYEHDDYCDETKSFQEKSRQYLENYGYVRVVNNISPDGKRSYEDWWVHPELVDGSILSNMLCINDTVKKAEDYILSPKSSVFFKEPEPEIESKIKIEPKVEVIEKNKNINFDWGLFEKNKWMYDSIKKEFDDEVNYEKFFSVEEDDIVVDIGASVGPFAKSIINKNPQKVICLEPHSKLYETLYNNLNQYENVTCINKGISSHDGEVIFENLFDDRLDSNYVGDGLWRKTDKGFGITFRTLIRENNLDRIDFLKTDCEGGEYDIFTSDNFYWIKNNVKKIAGEWHLHTDELKKKFIDFRDFYLRKFDNFKVFFVDYHSNFFDITDEIWSNDFTTKYGWVNIYINNQ